MTRLLASVTVCAALACAHAPKAAPPPQVGKFKVHGRVVGHDGQALKYGHARLWPLERLSSNAHEYRQVELGADGSYLLATDTAGYQVLEFTAVDHARTRLLVVLDGTLAIDVALGTYPGGRGDKFVDWHLKGKRGGGRLKLVQQADGTWVAEGDLPSGPVHYNIRGFAENRGVNGTTGGPWEYDRDGDYYSEVEVPRGRGKIVIDPAKRPPMDLAAKITFVDVRPESIALAMALEHALRVRDVVPGARVTGDAAMQAFWVQTVEALRSAADEAKTPDARKVLLLGVLWAAKRSDKPELFQASDFDRVLAEVQPTEALWSTCPEGVATLSRATDAAAIAGYLERMGGHSAAPNLRAEALLVQLKAAAANHDQPRARALFARFSSDPALVSRRKEAVPFDPDRALGPGAELPHLDLAPLPGSGVRVTNASIRGKVTLIDIWGPWCEPCIAALPRLHALHARYQRAKRPLSIVSVAVKTTADDVEEVRKTWPMPWTHALIRGWFNAEAVKAFGLDFVPFMILVDEHGKVLAVSPELTSDNLETELARILDPM